MGYDGRQIRPEVQTLSAARTRATGWDSPAAHPRPPSKKTRFSRSHYAESDDVSDTDAPPAADSAGTDTVLPEDAAAAYEALDAGAPGVVHVALRYQ